MLRNNIPPYIENLRDINGNASLTINGSSVNQIYSITPGLNNTLVIKGIVIVLEDSGTSGFMNFGAIQPLQNGLLFQQIIGGQQADITNIKNNADLVTRFSRSHFGSSAVGSLGGPIGFGESNDVFIGYLEFPSVMILRGLDELRVVVRDDLRPIGFLNIAVIGGKTND